MYITHALRGEGFDASEDGTGRGTPLVTVFHPLQDPVASEDSAHALGCGGRHGQCTAAVAVALRGRDGGGMAELGGAVANALRSSGGGGDKPYVLTVLRNRDGRRLGVSAWVAVRRMTPRECERLQGIPDDYTLIPWHAKPAG